MSRPLEALERVDTERTWKWLRDSPRRLAEGSLRIEKLGKSGRSNKPTRAMFRPLHYLPIELEPGDWVAVRLGLRMRILGTHTSKVARLAKELG